MNKAFDLDTYFGTRGGRNIRSIGRGAVGAGALAAGLRGADLLYDKTIGRLFADPKPEDIEIFIDPPSSDEDEEDEQIRKYSSLKKSASMRAFLTKAKDVLSKAMDPQMDKVMGLAKQKAALKQGVNFEQLMTPMTTAQKKEFGIKPWKRTLLSEGIAKSKDPMFAPGLGQIASSFATVNPGKTMAGLGGAGLGIYGLARGETDPASDKYLQLVPGQGGTGWSDSFYTALGVVPGFMAAHALIKKFENYQQQREFENKVREVENLMNRKKKDEDMEKESSVKAAEEDMYKSAVVKGYMDTFNETLLKRASESPRIKKALEKQAQHHVRGMEKYAFAFDMFGGEEAEGPVSSTVSAGRDMLGTVGDIAGSGAKAVSMATHLYPFTLGLLAPMGFMMGKNLVDYHLDDLPKPKRTNEVVFKVRDKKKKKKKKVV